MASIEKWVWGPSESHGPSGASDSERLLEFSRGLRHLVPELCGGPWKWLNTLDQNRPQQSWEGAEIQGCPCIITFLLKVLEVFGGLCCRPWFPESLSLRVAGYLSF